MKYEPFVVGCYHNVPCSHLHIDKFARGLVIFKLHHFYLVSVGLCIFGPVRNLEKTFETSNDFFAALQDESVLIWFSGKEEKHLKLSHVSRIISGQRTVSILLHISHFYAAMSYPSFSFWIFTAYAQFFYFFKNNSFVYRG